MKVRTHEETLEFAEGIVRNELEVSTNGIKSHRALLMFDYVDVIRSVSVDIMHGIALGLVKDIVEIWIGKKTIPKPPYDDYKFKTVNSRNVLDGRIKNLKSTAGFKRKPKSIFEISNFKASELIHFLWHYWRYAIVGHLPTRIVKNFEKLSAGSYLLCKKNATFQEIKNACDMLKRFADKFEEVYGPRTQRVATGFMCCCCFFLVLLLSATLYIRNNMYSRGAGCM